MYQVSQVPGITGTRYHRYQVSQIPGITGTRYQRYQVSHVPGITGTTGITGTRQRPLDTASLVDRLSLFDIVTSILRHKETVSP